MLPDSVQKFIIRKLPKNRDDKYVKDIIEKFTSLYSKEYTDSLVLSQDDAKKIFDKIGLTLDKNKKFIEFYSHSLSDPESCCKDLLYGLNEIYENYQNPFWGREYPNITDRYLQLSSIEGEHSYFYDKETDAVYSVDWSEMDDFMAGKLQPRWKSFYDFLEWYYGDEEE